MEPELSDFDHNPEDFVPKKVRGVNTYKKHHFHDQSEEHHTPHLENPMTVVDDLEKHFGIRITGSKRTVLEAFAYFNLRGHPATNTEIYKNLRHISYENIRKITKRLDNTHGKGLLFSLQERKGHEKQYVLANMLGIIPQESKYNTRDYGNSKILENHDENLIENNLMQTLSNKPNAEFHHISLKTELKVTNDYHRIRWLAPSLKNKAKVLENHLSLHRSYKIMVYPKGTVVIMIKSSKHPFRWYNRDDWISFAGSCGSIHQIFRDELSLSEPLIHTSESDWIVTQLHIGYDIPQISIENSKGSFILIDINGCLKVKHLDRVYQVYSKQLPYKGNCIRVEEQINFPSHSPSPTLSSLPKTVNPPSIESILDIVIPNS